MTSIFKSNRNIVYDCHYHVIFCPKYRRPVLTPEVSKRFKQIADELAKELRFEIEQMELMPDHVHILISCDPQFGIHKVVKRLKGRSSKYLREEFSDLRTKIPTLWTNSYFVATVGGAPLEVIKQYIETQQLRG